MVQSPQPMHLAGSTWCLAPLVSGWAVDSFLGVDAFLAALLVVGGFMVAGGFRSSVFTVIPDEAPASRLFLDPG